MEKKIKGSEDLAYSNYHSLKYKDYCKGKKVWAWNFVFDLFSVASRKFAKGKDVLDMGCGAGGLVHEFHKWGYDSHGVDFDSVQIETAMRVSEELGMEIDLRVGDFDEDLSWGKKFDIITSKDVAEHLPNEYLDKFISQSYTLLKSNGLLMVFTKPTKFAYLFDRPYAFLLLPMFFSSSARFRKYIVFLDKNLPRFYKKIFGEDMPNSWQMPPPGHCNCPELLPLARRIRSHGFKIIIAEIFFLPGQRWNKILYKFFPFDELKTNIFIVASK